MKFMLHAMLAACAIFSSPAKADVMNVGRDSLYTISFSDKSFAGANARYNVTIGIEGEEDECCTSVIMFP